MMVTFLRVAICLQVRLLKNEVDKCREQLRQAGEELWAAREQLQQVTLSW